MQRRTALTLIEILVVLFILGSLLGLLLPAVQSSREKARETVCKNNLHQINLAIAHFVEARKRLPDPSAGGVVGGWTIDILPYLEHTDLHQRIQMGAAIAEAPDMLLVPPQIFQCPVRDAMEDNPSIAMQSGHYVFVPSDRRDSFSLYDSPIQLSVPWASGPEMAPRTVTRTIGPHHGGFFYARGFQQGIDFIAGVGN